MKVSSYFFLFLFLWAESTYGQALKLPCGVNIEDVGEEPQILNKEEYIRLTGYPKRALKKKIEGDVILYVEIDRKGRVSQYDIPNRDQVHPILSLACETHIRKLKFSPARDHQGNPLPFCLNIPYSFHIKDVVFQQYQMANINYVAAQYKEAIKLYEKVLDLEEENLLATIMKGASYVHVGNPYASQYFKQAISLIQDLVENDPEEWKILQELAVTPYAYTQEVEHPTKNQKLLGGLSMAAAYGITMGSGIPMPYYLPRAVTVIQGTNDPQEIESVEANGGRIFSPLKSLAFLQRKATDERLVKVMIELQDLLKSPLD